MSFFVTDPSLLGVVLTNAVLATLVACLAALAERLQWRSSVIHGLWLLVLLRLLAPPLVSLELLPRFGKFAATAAAVDEVGGTSPSALLGAADEVGGTSSGGTSSGALLGAADEVGGTSSQDLGQWNSPPSSEGASGFGTPSSVDSVSSVPMPRSLVIAPWIVVWLMVSMLLLIKAVRRVRRFLAMARTGEEAPQAILRQAESLAAELNLRSCPKIRVVEDRRLGSPMVLGVFGPPKLLLPKDLVSSLRTSEMATVLAHELAHLRRRDHWARWPELLASVLFWWHPVVWWARKALRRVEERCVDEWVLRLLPGSRRAYAEALLKTLELDSKSPFKTPALASGIETLNSMESRLKMILRSRNASVTTSPTTRDLLLRWLAPVAAVTMLLVLPTWARTGGDDVQEASDSTVFEESGVAQEEQRLLEIEMHRKILHQRNRLQATQRQGQRAAAEQQLASMRQNLEQVSAVRSAAVRDGHEMPAEAAQHEERLRQKIGLLEERLQLDLKEEEQEALEMEIHRLALALEEAHLKGDDDAVARLEDQQFGLETQLQKEVTQRVEKEMGLQQKQLQQELEHLRHERELMASRESATADATRELEQLDREVERIHLHKKRLAMEQEMQAQRMALDAERRLAENEIRAFERQHQREAAELGHDQAKMEARLEAKAREYEAKQEALESKMRQQEVRMRLKALRSEVPMQIEELRAALEDAGDDSELRAELERLHRELGEVLKN